MRNYPPVSVVDACSSREGSRHSTKGHTNMRIGIIGAGQIGGTLTRRLTALGHDVRVSNSRTPETLADLEAETGAKAVLNTEAAEGADLVIVSIPQKNVVDLPTGILAGAADGAPVIETNNYYPQQRDGLIAAIEDGQVESEWVQEHLGVPVFKAFNGIWWKHLLEKGLPEGSSGRIALPVAGDDALKKQVVFDLINQLGFDPVDAGTVEDSWRQQPGTPVYGKNFDREATLKALAQATPERTDEWRAVAE
ncbi:NADPH-dependent F420 reductase [Rhodococcus wratislaviensis]|nr:NAD(P)-binding domain-containing protein [Rhodococcus wratislaviensis]